MANQFITRLPLTQGVLATLLVLLAPLSMGQEASAQSESDEASMEEVVVIGRYKAAATDIRTSKISELARA